jgi:hypothetical protein
MNETMTLNLERPDVIALVRRSVERLYREGYFTAEERAVALGNMDEAAAKLRMRAAKN